MGNITASGTGVSLEVGKNCQKESSFNSTLVISVTDPRIYKLKYSNSKFGKACLAGTIVQVNNTTFNILAQNKDFNFQWQFIKNEDTDDYNISGNHTKKCEKNSLSISEQLKFNMDSLGKETKEKINSFEKNVLNKIK